MIDPDRLPRRPRTRRWVELYVALTDADTGSGDGGCEGTTEHCEGGTEDRERATDGRVDGADGREEAPDG